MKNVIACLLLVSFPLSLLAQNLSNLGTTNEKATTSNEETIVAQGDPQTGNEQSNQGYDAGYNDGRMGGLQRSQSTWMIAGCGGGFLVGCIGGGVVWLLASGSGDYPPYIPNGNSEYKNGYIMGYQDATKSKKGSNALIGGLLGTAIAVVAVVAYYSSGE